MQVDPESQQPQPTPLLASVLIVCYNRAAALRRCLQALMASQEHERLDVIVLDTGSRDGSGRLDTDFPDVTFLRMPRNFGATKALNIGIRTAKADMLLLLDPAVEVRPSTIPDLAKLLDSTPDAGALCPLLVDHEGRPVPQVRRLPDKDQLAQVWRDPSAIPAATPDAQPLVASEFPGRKALLIRKTFLKGMNYFDERYGDFGGDLELAFQIRHASKKAYIARDIPAVDHSTQEAEPAYSAGQRAIFAADRLNGASHFLGKRAGATAEGIMRISAVLGTFLRALTFQDPGFNWPLLTALLSGQKIDGSQGKV